MSNDHRGKGAWKQVLRQVPFFIGLDEEGLSLIANACVRRDLGAKSTLFYEGDDGYCLFVIDQGTVQIRKEVSSGPIVLAERSAGDVIGEMALLDGEPRSATAVTVTRCTLYELSRDRFLQCIQRRPELTLGMLAMMTQRLREANHRLAHRLMPVEVRLAALLVTRMAQQPQNTSSPVLLGKLTNAEIGRQIGTTRETVSRKMDVLLQQGIVFRDTQGLWVHHPDTLKEIAAQE